MRSYRVVRAVAVLAWIGAGGAGCGDDEQGSAQGPVGKADASARDAAAAAADAAGDAAGPSDAGTSVAATWVTMGGDARNSYHNASERELTVENVGGLKEKWRFEVAGFPPGSPAVAEGKVFVLATGGAYALDFDSGAELWKRSDLVGTSSIGYADGSVYVHAVDGSLYKLDAKDGSTQWGPVKTYPEVASCDGTSSPVVVETRVIVGHSCGRAEVSMTPDKQIARGGVEAFDIADGARAWRYFTVPEGGENGAMVWSTVGADLDSRLVFATTGNNYTLVGENSDAIHAIDLDSGELRWKTQVRANDVWSIGSDFMNPTEQSLDTDFGANPIVADVGDRKLVAAGDKAGAFWALDRATGEIVWSREQLSGGSHPATGGVLNSGAFDGESFFVSVNEPTAESLLHVLDARDGEDRVEPVKLGAIAWGALSIANGVLYVPVNSVLKIFDAATLEELASFDTGGTIAAGAPVVVDGQVIVGSGLQYGFAMDAILNNQVIAYSLEGGAPDRPVDAGMAVGESTWSAVYEDIIVATGCNGAALCHASEMGGLKMSNKSEAYAALVGVEAMGANMGTSTTPNCADLDLVRVVPRDPDASLLVQKLEGTQPCGDRMPPTAELSGAQVDQVRAWIASGALDD
jgi:polyvinyl alcohol dehydrogenase (cytochrome)